MHSFQSCIFSLEISISKRLAMYLALREIVATVACNNAVSCAHHASNFDSESCSVHLANFLRLCKLT